jgi:hypothetical protein
LPHLLLDELWPLAQQALSRSQNLGLAISAARHRLETNWGLDTLEVPLSTIYSQVSFHRFFWQLLCDLPRFRDSYNGALQDFRAVNHVRSRSHPVPDLAAEADWLEAPFWIWSREQPRRQRLFVRRNARGLDLTDRHGITIRCGVQGEESLTLEQFAALEKRGIKLRPRALLTTMYARLVLSDLFIHGIGGAKYDELTDAIIQHFFGLTPPHYLTATATLTLPVAYPKVSGAELLAQQQAVRTVEFHAETLLREHPLAQRKQALLAALPPRGARRAWHAEMATVQDALQAATTTVHQEALAQLTHTQERYRYSRLLHSREFSFCLFPTELIRSLLLDLCRIKS